MDDFIPSPLASTGHRTVVASAGFLRWAMPTEGGIMQGVIHLLQGGHGPGVSSCILSTNRYISGLDRPGWFWPRIPLPTLRLLESQVSQHGVLLDFVGGGTKNPLACKLSVSIRDYTNSFFCYCD